MKKDDFIYKELKTQENRLKYISGIMAGNTSSDYYPRRVYIEPTNMCNCRCIHCPGRSHMTRKKGLMSFDLFRKIIDEVGPLWPYVTINLYQHGEPLLHPRIFDMIEYAQNHNLFVKMNTNLGALKRQDIPRLLELDYLEISLDAASRESYKMVKGVDIFHRVMDNLLDFLEAWSDNSTPASYACDVSFLVQEANRDMAEVFEELFSRLPIGHVNVYPLHNFTGAISEGSANMPDRNTIERKTWPCCNTPWDIVGVQWDGRVTGCVYDYDSRWSVGNVNESTLLECWNSEAMQRFRQALLDRDYREIEREGPLCSECSILWLEDYALPKDFHREVARMEQYLSAAIDRVANQKPRHEVIMEKAEYLRNNRQNWLKELAERTEGK